jgi:hypothetical protein
MAKLTIQRTPHRPGVMIAASMALSALVTIGTTNPASSAPLHPTISVPEQTKDISDIVQVRAVARRGGVAVGPRGGAVAYRSRTVVRGPAVRPGGAAAVRRAAWARPGHYYWPRGGAIAAGAAIGMVTAATAAAWAGAAPAPGMCWYYTDPSRTQGFWDYCR